MKNNFLETGPSIKKHNKLTDWFLLDEDNKLNWISKTKTLRY